ncbi:MAG TPA: ABC transporter permease [Anaerolineales bacterium]|nr:ABC transporter permease [Anaerolineales bacterium]
MLDRITTIFLKEFTDNLRDRRTVFSSIFFSMLGPVIILGLIIVLGRSVFRDQVEKPLELPVIGAENAPNLIAFLKQNNVVITSAPDDPETAVRNGDVSVVLLIAPEYGDVFRSGEPAPVQVVLDTSRTSAVAEIQRLRTLLNAYSSQIGSLRLLVRGVSPSITEALAIEQVDVATPQSQVLIFLNMLPYLLMFTIFNGGSGVIIDATAGERERNSLEPLLINPVSRREFVIGKLLASLPFACLALLASLTAFAVVFNVVPVEEFVGFRLSIDIGALVGIFLISLPMIVLASALQMIIATFSRSFKEAQTYVGILPLVPAMPGLGLAFLPVKPELWTMLVPTFGQQILINQFMRGEPINPLNLAASAFVTIVLAGVFIAIAFRLYEGERVLFGRS